MSTDRTTANNMTRQSFRGIWGASDERGALNLCNQIRRACGLGQFSPAEFQKGRSRRNIFASNYTIAHDEFVALCLGTW